jgi:hypothetical protein
VIGWHQPGEIAAVGAAHELDANRDPVDAEVLQSSRQSYPNRRSSASLKLEVYIRAFRAAKAPWKAKAPAMVTAPGMAKASGAS